MEYSYCRFRSVCIPTGFNPTFGPVWVSLYGSPQNSALRDVHKDLNEGLGEGIFYRGRLLMAITVDIFSTIQAAEKKPVEVFKGALSKLKLKKISKKAKEKSKASIKAHQQSEAEVVPEEAEQPNEVIVEVEELHPLPEVSLIIVLGRKCQELEHLFVQRSSLFNFLHYYQTILAINISKTPLHFYFNYTCSCLF